MNNTTTRGFAMHKPCKQWLATAMLASVSMWVPPASAAQLYFESADVAANTLVLAVARNDVTAMSSLLGEDYRQVLPVTEISDDEKNRFFDAWAGFHTLIATDGNTRMLAAGENGWTLPIPIIREDAGWRFDTVTGGQLMRIRAIGRNELSAMQAVLAYHDAQMEYAAADHDGDGVAEYAQVFLSTPGKKDGLYWEVVEGEPVSPLGPLFASGVPEYGYHGYHYRILTSQGEFALGGKQSYLLDGNMTGGFALVAWPAQYGSSGVMSFMLGGDGVLYEADLGQEGSKLASGMQAFDPGPLWMPVSALYTGL